MGCSGSWPPMRHGSARGAAAGYAGVGRLAFAIVLEAHDLRDGLANGRLGPPEVVPVVADSAARLWAVPVGGPGTVRPPNPFLSRAPAAGSIAELAEIGPEGAAVISDAIGPD